MRSGRQAPIVSSSLGSAAFAFRPAKISRNAMALTSAAGTWRKSRPDRRQRLVPRMVEGRVRDARLAQRLFDISGRGDQDLVPVGPERLRVRQQRLQMPRSPRG